LWLATNGSAKLFSLRQSERKCNDGALVLDSCGVKNNILAILTLFVGHKSKLFGFTKILTNVETQNIDETFTNIQ